MRDGGLGRLGYLGLRLEEFDVLWMYMHEHVCTHACMCACAHTHSHAQFWFVIFKAEFSWEMRVCLTGSLYASVVCLGTYVLDALPEDASHVYTRAETAASTMLPWLTPNQGKLVISAGKALSDPSLDYNREVWLDIIHIYLNGSWSDMFLRCFAVSPLFK